MAKNALSAARVLAAQNLIQAVCESYKVSMDALCGGEFYEPLITARNVAMYLLIHQEGLSRNTSGALLRRSPRAAGYAFYHIAVLREGNGSLEERIRQIQEFTMMNSEQT